MSILCCRVPDFLINLTCGPNAESQTHPLALLGPDERICALSAPARQMGVRLQMTPRQAQIRCPAVRLHPVDMEVCGAEQAAFLSTLSRWQLPVEAQSWGLAYLDTQTLASAPAEAKQLGADMGRMVRQALGEPLQPALGWDSGKFTARVAAGTTPPGHMRLVDKAQERQFLAPLSIHLLPLPGDTLQELHWLGIRTLGQFAALPPTAVWQRFGKAGRAAQRWAMGYDDRPVCHDLSPLQEPPAITLDSPTGQVQMVLDALMHGLQPALQALADRMEGCRRLQLQIHFCNGAKRSIDLACVEPVGRPERLRSLLQERLETLIWPAEAEQITVLGLERAELAVEQLPLLAEERGESPDSDALLIRFIDKYGAIFWGGELLNPHHPVDERRIRLATLT